MLRATAIALVTAAALLVGCSSGAGGGDEDAAPADGRGGGDGDVGGGGGLSFAFTTTPALPDVTAAVSVDEVRLGFRDVRAIGDSANGDARTSIGSWPLRWRPGSDPAPLSFPLAPRGIYSVLEARLGGGDGLEIRGRVRLTGGQTVDFRIESDDLSGSVSVSLEGLTLDTGARSATILLSLAFLGDLDWNALAHGDDQIEINHDSPQMAAIETALRAGFSLGTVR